MVGHAVGLTVATKKNHRRSHLLLHLLLKDFLALCQCYHDERQPRLCSKRILGWLWTLTLLSVPGAQSSTYWDGQSTKLLASVDQKDPAHQLCETCRDWEAEGKPQFEITHFRGKHGRALLRVLSENVSIPTIAVNTDGTATSALSCCVGGAPDDSKHACCGARMNLRFVSS